MRLLPTSLSSFVAAGLLLTLSSSAQQQQLGTSSNIKHIQLAYLHDKMIDDVSGGNDAIKHHERRLQSINPAQIAQVRE